jgi:hypothetical protein
MVVSSETLRPGYTLAVVVTCLQLFCISSVRCIGGMNKVFVWWSRGALLVFLDLPPFPITASCWPVAVFGARWRRGRSSWCNAAAEGQLCQYCHNPRAPLWPHCYLPHTPGASSRDSATRFFTCGFFLQTTSPGPSRQA